MDPSLPYWGQSVATVLALLLSILWPPTFCSRTLICFHFSLYARMYASRIKWSRILWLFRSTWSKGLSAHLYQTVHIIPAVARQQDMYHNNASYTDISSRRTVVPCSRFTVRPQQWSALLRFFNGFSGEFVDFRWDAVEVQNLLPHETIDDPVGCRIIF